MQKGLVSDSSQAEEYIRRRLGYSFLYTDLLAVRLAYESACHKSIEELEALENILEASRVPFELRDASRRLGSRLSKPWRKWISPLTLLIFRPISPAGKKEPSATPAPTGLSVPAQA